MKILQQLTAFCLALTTVIVAQQVTGVTLIGTTLTAFQSSGDVVGPSASVDGEIALFSGITGKLLRRATSTGVVKMTSGVASVVTGTATDCIRVNGTTTSCSGGGGGGTYTAGIGLTESGGEFTVDTGAVPTFLTTTTSIDVTSITSGRCVDSTFTMTGAAVSDAVAPRWPATLEGGLAGTMFVSATNTIKVRLCNNTAASVDPINQTYGATIVRSF